MLSSAVLSEIERLTGSSAQGFAAPNATIFDVTWPKGVTYRTVADDRADREVLCAELGIRREVGKDHVAFGTSHNGKVMICVATADPPSDPMVWLAPEKSAPMKSHPLSIFLASLEREPTRGRREPLRKRR